MIKTDKLKYPEIVLIIILTVLVGGLFAYYRQFKKPSGSAIVTIGDTAISVEIADTSLTQSHGLSDRDSLKEDSGMLFVFDEADIQYFWMNKMRFPLDVIWINNGYVVGVSRNIPPPYSEVIPRMNSEVPADWVVEVNAGFVDEHGIAIGDKVRLQQK